MRRVIVDQNEEVVCPHCGKSHPRFKSDQRICRDCWNERSRAYRATHADKYREHSRDYCRRNPEKGRQRAREYAKRNPDKVKANARAHHLRTYAAKRDQVIAKAKAWHDANPERTRAAKLRWSRKNASYWRELRKRFPAKAREQGCRKNRLRRVRRDRVAYAYSEILRRDPCSYCQEPAGEIDHIQPVTGGGSNAWSNLTASCRGCNGRKFTTPLLKFLLKRGVMQ